MLGDPWPEEPDDPFTDPAAEAAADVPSPDDVPRELYRAFWWLVAVFNVAVLAVSLGILLLVFRRAWLVGGSLLGLGLALSAYGFYRYRAYTRSDLLSE